MKYREYKFLKKLYKIAPQMDEKQNYKSHDIDEIVKYSDFNTTDVLTLVKALEKFDFVSTLDNTNGYIYMAAITYSGVSAMKHYYKDIIMKVIWSIIIPAIISLIVSLIAG